MGLKGVPRLAKRMSLGMGEKVKTLEKFAQNTYILRQKRAFFGLKIVIFTHTHITRNILYCR